MTRLGTALTPRVSLPRVLLRTLQNPLLRNGHLLTLSSALTSLIGLGYWVVTAWKYEPAAVGRNYAAISMMMLLAALAQLNLSSAMVRFVPGAGRHTMRFVACAYLVSGSLAVAVSTCFLALLERFAPALDFLDDPLLGGSFIVATAAYTIFVLQDSVLTGLRRTAWVPLENTVFACVKMALVVILATSMPAFGIFESWMLSLVGVVLVTSALLLRWAIPHHQRRNNGHSTLPPLGQIGHFVAADYVGAVCSMAASTMLPVMVITVLGPEQSAYFSLAWLIAFTLHLVNINMGASLVVETAVDQSQLARCCRQMLSHTSRLLVPAVIVMMVLAPYLLGVFGQPYRAASDLLRLLALASLPHLLVTTALSSARAQRRMTVVMGALGSLCVLSLTLGWVLLHVMGLAGVGLAWLLAQSLVAGALLVRRDLWLSIGPATRRPATRRPATRRPATRRPATRRPATRRPATRRHGARSGHWPPVLVAFWVRLALASGVGRWVQGPRARRAQRRARRELAALLPVLLPTVPAQAGHPDPTTWTRVRPVPTVSDLTVALLAPGDDAPVAVLKLAHAPETAQELRAQHDALTVLRADPRLAGWRELLPRVIELREQDNRVLALETFLPTTTLATLLTHRPGDLERVLSGVLGAIADLHHRTGRTEVVEHSQLARWVAEPLASLREMCLACDPGSVGTLERLDGMLRDALSGRRVQVSWAHGDFTPGNVLLSADGERVSGIVDWGGARPAQLALLDSYLMLLTASCLTEGRELGAVVSAWLRAGGLPEDQRRLLAQSCAPPPTRPGPDVLEERAVILLAWLHHVAELRRKCSRYREHRVWWACNVDPVLRTFAAPAITTAGAARLDEPPAKLGVSVVICSYTDKRWDELVSSVDSVRRQTEPPEEIVVVIDHCPALLRRAARELTGVRVVPNRGHQGLSGARNTGLAVATCEVVAFLDDDAVAADGWIAGLLTGYADPRVAGVGGRVRPNWHEGRPAWFPTEFDWVVGCSYRGLPTSRGPVRNFIGANMSFRRELLRSTGGFHTGLGRIGTRPLGCEETELCIRMQREHAGSVLLYEPAAQVWHSVPAARGTWSYFRSRCYAEGLSKAAVSRLAGANQALAAERSYLTRTITRGIMRSLGHVLHGRPSGIGMALAMVVGVTTTVLGYVVGRAQTHRLR